MSETFDRSSFKGSTLTSIKEEQGRAAAALPKLGGGNRAGFLKIEDGKNWRRVAPAHHPSEPAYRASSTVMLEVMVKEIDEDGKETGKEELKRKPIFIATQHSSVLKEDPILLYISYVNEAANLIQDKDARSKFLAPVRGWRGKDGKWNWGIQPSVDYVFYCWDDKGNFGRDRLFPFMLDQMKKISIQQSSDDAEIVPDIFSDPDYGYPLIITKGKSDKGKSETSCSCELPNPQTRETWDQFWERHRLTDAQLIELTSKESLKELYEDVYTSRDFAYALDGLRRFDTAFKYGIFENEEFLERLVALKALVPAYKPKEEVIEGFTKPGQSVPPVKPAVVTPDPIVPKQPAINGTAATPIVMKRFLREYILSNYGEGVELPATLAGTDLISWYELAQSGDELPFEETSPAAPENNIPTPPVQASTPKQETAAPIVNVPAAEIPIDLQKQIDALRSKRTSSAGKS